MILNRTILIAFVLCSKFICAQCDHDLIAVSGLCSGNYEVGQPIIFSTEGPTNGDAFWNIGNGLYTEEIFFWEMEEFDVSYTFEEAGIYSIYFSFDNFGECFFEDSITIEVLESSITDFVPDYLGNNPKWCVLYENSICSNCDVCTERLSYSIGGDTIFDSVVFKKLMANGVRFGCGPTELIDPYIETYLRQEGEVIYRHYPDEDTTIVMYDFTLEVGDTLPTGGLYSDLQDGDQLFPEELGYYVITEVDSVCFDGNYYKKFNFSTPYPFADIEEAIYEGMGHTKGLLYPHREWTEFETFLTVVFRINEEVFFGVSVYNCDINIDVEEVIQNPDFTIYPNPSSGLINLVGLEGQKYDLKIYSSSGHLIYSQRSLMGNNELSLELDPGIYLMQIESKGRFLGVEKLIIK